MQSNSRVFVPGLLVMGWGGAAGGSRNGGGEKGFHLFSSLVSSYRDSHFYHATTFI